MVDELELVKIALETEMTEMEMTPIAFKSIFYKIKKQNFLALI
jgi:hypothetical protein